MGFHKYLAFRITYTEFGNSLYTFLKSHIFDKFFKNKYVPYCVMCPIKFLRFCTLGYLSLLEKFDLIA